MRGIVLAVAGVVALKGAATPFRFSRPIEAAPGWARLELPDDVLDACRPGLPDLRIEDGTGREVPFAVEQDVHAASRRFTVDNLESIDRVETTGMIDRGPNPGFAGSLTFEIAGNDFLKPVRVQSSEDRVAWSDVARGSIFAAGDVRMLTLRLPGNDRRYFRFRLDDRNGAPVRPEAVVVRAQAGAADSGVRERPLALNALAAESDTESLYSAALPAGNLDVTALRFEAQDPAFSRRVRIRERVFFRDEVFRRLLAEGTITRAPGSEGGPLDLPTPGIAGRNLEIEIENGDSPPLERLTVQALFRGRSIRFFAPEGVPLRLRYGSRDARAPKYDLAQASEGGVAQAVPEASLGPAVAQAAGNSPPPAPARVALADAEKWTNRRPIALPRATGLAYLDLDDPPRGLSDLRIVDTENRQVPFIVEQGAHEHRRKLRTDVTANGRVTRVSLGEPSQLSAATAIELSATGPDYFSREVTVQQEEHDARGVVATRTLGAAHWERKPGERPPVLRIALDRARPAQGPLFAAIENGDNVPITVGDAWIRTSAVRLDFIFEKGDQLFLLSGNPEAGSPAYDFAMLASVILASPADPARLGPKIGPSPSAPRRASWFWVVIVATILVLVFELSRTLRKNP